MARRVPVHNLEVLRSVVADLALLIKHERQYGRPCDVLFTIICDLFDPLINKMTKPLIEKFGISLEDAQHELRTTLFESIVDFDLTRVRDANLFAYFIKQRIWFATAWRVSRVLKDLPISIPTGPSAHPAQGAANALLRRIEAMFGTEAADLAYCLCSSSMSQKDATRVFKCSQQTISVRWNSLRAKLREVLEDSRRRNNE